MPEQDVPKGDDPLDQGTEVEMPPKSGADDAPSEGATAPVSGPPPAEDVTMEVDEGLPARIPLAQSPERMTISSMRMRP